MLMKAAEAAGPELARDSEYKHQLFSDPRLRLEH